MSLMEENDNARIVIFQISTDQESIEDDNISDITSGHKLLKKGKSWKGLKFTFSKKQKEDIKEAFDLFDTLGNGLVESSYLKVAFRALGIEPGRKEIRNLDLLPKYLCYEEFLEQLRMKMTSLDEYNDIIKMFQLFDTYNTGKLKYDELKRVAQILEEDITDEEINEMLYEADITGDRYIDFKEFTAIMQRIMVF